MQPSIVAIAGIIGGVGAKPLAKRTEVQGFDISSYQPSVDFTGAYGSGARFVYIKATEGTTITDPTFSSHLSNATSAGFIHGAYHFARPDAGSGADQANYFLENGGKWTNDGKTLPGMLDMEYGETSACYGLSAASMTAWVHDFVDTYQGAVGRFPVIYTTADWWGDCTRNATDFAQTCPLMLALYDSTPGTIPGGWASQTIWQNSETYQFGGDSDVFDGSVDDLARFAGSSTPTPVPSGSKRKHDSVHHRADPLDNVRWV